MRFLPAMNFSLSSSVNGFPAFWAAFFRSFAGSIAEAAHQNETPRLLFKDVFDCRQRRHNARIVLNDAVFHRNVEIDSHDDALIFQIDIFYGFNHNVSCCNGWNFFAIRFFDYDELSMNTEKFYT